VNSTAHNPISSREKETLILRVVEKSSMEDSDVRTSWDEPLRRRALRMLR
jgi:hypothetical protein